jgi:hypothetical protein
MANNFKMRLVSVTNNSEAVIFDVTPTLSESRRVEYTAVTPIHMPGSVQVYKSTGSRSFSLAAKLISRTPDEASTNKRRLQLMRAWQMPYFGSASGSSSLTAVQVSNREQLAVLQRTGNGAPIDLRHAQVTGQNGSTTDMDISDQGFSLLGAPPSVLYLYAYSSAAENGRSTGIPNLNRIPVVIESFETSFPDDVDYIASSDNQVPFPVRIEVTLGLLETHSPTEYTRFSLDQFKSGTLINF